MMSQTQRDVIAALAELCELSPDVRLGQLMAHLGFLGEDQAGQSLWEIDDENLLAVLNRHRDELRDRGFKLPMVPDSVSNNSTLFGQNSPQNPAAP